MFKRVVVYQGLHCCLELGFAAVKADAASLFLFIPGLLKLLRQKKNHSKLLQVWFWNLEVCG